MRKYDPINSKATKAAVTKIIWINLWEIGIKDTIKKLMHVQQNMIYFFKYSNEMDLVPAIIPMNANKTIRPKTSISISIFLEIEFRKNVLQKNMKRIKKVIKKLILTNDGIEKTLDIIISTQRNNSKTKKPS